LPDARVPGLSVVLVTDVWATIEKTVEHLRRQTARDRLELVVVAPEGAEVGVDEAAVGELGGGCQVVRVPEIRSLSWARAPGVRAARAPVVVFGESHSYPDECWAEALLEAHRGPWAAVGPQVRNANPHTRLSWVNLLLDYGPWLGPTSGGELVDLPGHNSAYKKEVLLGLGDDLTELLEAETLMHVALRRRGHRLYQEPGAILFHLNVSRISAWLQERFQTGRRFGGARGHEWRRWRRLAYALGSPLIPFVRLPRLLRDRERIGARKELSGWTFPLLFTALIVSAFGEFVGYLLGSGESMYELSEIELHKDRFISSREREAISAG
jgi:hypothetical protein